MKKSILKSTALVLCAGLVCCLLLTAAIFDAKTTQQTETQLRSLATALGSAYDANGDADAQASQFSRQIGGLRVTVIAKDGTVLGDSAADYKTMENHAGREELKAAEGAGVGISVRPSETLGTRLMYAAVRTQGGEYIRVAMQYNGFLRDLVSLLPALSMLGLLAALYSIYLLYTGLPVLMRSAPEKSVGYTVVVIIAAIVMGVVIGAVSALFMPRSGALFGGADAPAITMNTPGGKVSIDTAGLEAAGKKMEEAARKMEEAHKSQDPAAIAAATGDAAKAAAGVLGGGQAIAAQSLKAALPEKLAGLPRTGFDVQDGAALGLPTSQASAQYGNDDKQLRLEIALTHFSRASISVVSSSGLVVGAKRLTSAPSPLIRNLVKFHLMP